MTGTNGEINLSPVMRNYSYIIDEECNGEKTPKLVRQIIPDRKSVV